jgi:hypothetical protein
LLCLKIQTNDTPWTINSVIEERLGTKNYIDCLDAMVFFCLPCNIFFFLTNIMTLLHISLKGEVWALITCLIHPPFIEVHVPSQWSCICVCQKVSILAQFLRFTIEIWNCSDSMFFLLILLFLMMLLIFIFVFNFFFFFFYFITFYKLQLSSEYETT